MHYIFLTNNIGGIGGGQIYLSRKVEHLRSLGWKVTVYHFDSSPPSLAPLLPYTDNHIPGLCHRFATLPSRVREKVLRRMADPIDGNRAVVESYNIETALWAEALAQMLSQRMSAAHFLYILTETPPLPTLAERNFLMTKYHQNLLRGIMPQSLHRLLPEIPYGDGALLALAADAENVADIDHPRLHEQRPEEEFVILSVGRLEKPYIDAMLRHLRDFASSQKNLPPLRLVMIGDAKSKRLKEKLNKIIEDTPIAVEWWGFAYPVPREIMRRADLFIGSSGAVGDAAREGVPAIAYDAEDHMPIGLYGETTDNYLYRSVTEPPIPLSKLLLPLINNCKKRREMRKHFIAKPHPIDYSHHDAIADNAHQTTFYPVATIPPRGNTGRLLRHLNRLGLSPLIYLLKRLYAKL